MKAFRSQALQSINYLALYPNVPDWLDPLLAKGKGIMVWRVR
jgi:hypothetical protein